MKSKREKILEAEVKSLYKQLIQLSKELSCYKGEPEYGFNVNSEFNNLLISVHQEEENRREKGLNELLEANKPFWMKNNK